MILQIMLILHLLVNVIQENGTALEIELTSIIRNNKINKKACKTTLKGYEYSFHISR